MSFEDSNDSSVQATNDDATVSKLSCVQGGYFVDPFVHHFVKRPVKRSPVINRGYYARWAGMRKLLESFREACSTDNNSKGWQIVNLGAGFDTLFFVLKAEEKSPTHFYEIDFMEVVAKKSMTISRKPELKSMLPVSAKFEKEQIHSSEYSLLRGDLRDLKALDTALEAAGLDPSVPTLVIAECVLIYLDPKISRDIVQWTASKFATSAFVAYEQILPFDAFGHQMVINLQSRGCPLLGINDTPTLEAKIERFLTAGFQRGEAVDMDVVYNELLDTVDIRRIERLQLFDEFEEWHIMQEHYCICYGVNDLLGLLGNFGFGKEAHSAKS